MPNVDPEKDKAAGLWAKKCLRQRPRWRIPEPRSAMPKDVIARSMPWNISWNIYTVNSLFYQSLCI
jgi:hypothetical protein